MLGRSVDVVCGTYLKGGELQDITGLWLHDWNNISTATYIWGKVKYLCFSKERLDKIGICTGGFALIQHWPVFHLYIKKD